MPGDSETPNADANSDSQMLRCIERDQFFAAQNNADELVPAGAGRGGWCPNCGGDKFEQVVLAPERSIFSDI